MQGRFLLFTFYQYYPSGGVRDLQGHYDQLEDAQLAAKDSDADWYNIYDCEEHREVDSGDCKDRTRQ